MCTEVVNHSRIKVEENKKKAIFLNEERREFEVSEVDGCLIRRGIRCDKLVSRKDDHSVLIELKGSDVAHACDQLFESVRHGSVRVLLKERVGFLVVCAKYPRFDTFVRKAKEKAMREFRAGFHVVKNSGEFYIERVTAIDGPH
jgi:hypothetical protein